MYIHVHIHVPCTCVCVSLLTQIAVNNAHSSLMHGLLFQRMVLDHSPLAFKLIVERDNLVQDTLNHLVSTEPYNYKKPLQVHTVHTYMQIRIMKVGSTHSLTSLMLSSSSSPPPFPLSLSPSLSLYPSPSPSLSPSPSPSLSPSPPSSPSFRSPLPPPSPGGVCR